MNQWDDFLSRVDLFFGLQRQEREALVVNAEERELRRGKALVISNSGGEFIYVLARGALKTIQGESEGQRLLVDFIRPGEVVGEENLFLAGEHILTAIPFENASLVALPVANVRRVLDSQPRLGRALAALAAARSRAYRERLLMMSTSPVPARLAFTLHLLARRFGKRDKKGTLIALRITHQDLADYIGASRETVSLFLSRFRQKGLITMNVRRIIVPDLKALKKVASEK